jgi:hypothetical protein
LKVNQEIEKLKKRVSARQTCRNTATSPSHYQITRLNNGSQGTTESTTNTNNFASDQGSMQVRSVCGNSSSCNNVMQNDMHVCGTNVNVSPKLLVNCSSLNKLTLPVYSDNATEIIGKLLKELDIILTSNQFPEVQNCH